MRGSVPFTIIPTTGFEIAVYPPGATYGPRSLSTYEFVWVIEGDALYRSDDVTIDVPQGAVVLCQPGVRDFFRWDRRRQTRHAFFHFTMAGRLPDSWPNPKLWPLVRQARGDSDLLPILFQHLLSANRDPAQTQICLALLLAAFATGDTAPSAANGSAFISEGLPEPVRRAMRHVVSRLDEDAAAAITLDEMAAAACVTREYLCRRFKSATGNSPLATVRQIRLDRARKLLERTNYTVGEVAALSGFENAFHFSRAFKARFGQSPRGLRDTTNRD